MSGASSTKASPRNAEPVGALDLAAERAELGEDLSRVVEEVLHSGRYVAGPRVGSFERAFARLSSVAEAVVRQAPCPVLTLRQSETAKTS